MPVFTPLKSDKEQKIHHSQYIKTENEGDDGDAKPAEPAQPEQPETK